MTALEDSYRHCRRVARRRARNFYYSFLLLPRPQRAAVCAAYAFMRRCDDLSDEAGQASPAALAAWRRELESALEGRFGESPIWPALHHAVTRYKIPREYLFEMIEGVMSDLQPRRLQTFDELYRYCYQVASVVGLTVIHIFGFHSAEALPLAEKCGVAFQLTNILRDVREDLGRGRVYLPAEDLERFGVSPAELRDSKPSAGFLELMRFEAARARRYYDESRPLLGLVEAASRPSLWALIEIYSRLLGRIERSGFDVLARRISVPLPEKLWILARSCVGENR